MKESAQRGAIGLLAQKTDEPPRINLGWFSRYANDELIRP
jgi:hypothetical protein